MTALLAEYRLDELEVGAMLGEGGAAEVYRCRTADGTPMVLKRYQDDTLKDLDADALRHLIAWPDQLDDDDREQLFALCAWPRATVTDGGAVIGLLMAEAQTRFFFRRKDKLVPCHFTYIAVTKGRAEERNWPYYDFPHKIARFGHLLAALQFLHSHKIVVGDLQHYNILTTSPKPDSTGRVITEVFLLDCDSFIVDGRPALPPMDPQNMRPPYDYDGHSATTDMYKLAKLMIRCLSEDHGADSIFYDKFSNVLPSKDFALLKRLLTDKDPGISAEALGGLARAWQATVRSNGKLKCRLDRSLAAPWTEELRQAHLAGLAPPTVPPKPKDVSVPVKSESSDGEVSSEMKDLSVPVEGESSEGRITTEPRDVPAPRKGGKQSKGKVSPKPKDVPDSGEGENGAGGKDASDGSKKRKWLVAAIFAVVVAAIVIAAILVNKHYSAISRGPGTSTTSSYPTSDTPSPQSYAAPSTASASTDSPAVDNAIRSARPGQCLHKETGGADSAGGSVITALYVVGCGDSAATVRVVSTHTASSVSGFASLCGPSWSGTDSYPYVVICTTSP
jgi:hypothetical protein